jgi:hypothetical protein
MSRFSPIYQSTGLFCPFTVKSWVLASLLMESGKTAEFLTNRISQFIEARFKDGQYSTSAQARTPGSKTK